MSAKRKIMVAMSGGLDSSLAAAMLKKRGDDVIGATMKLWPDDECEKAGRRDACCSLAGIEDARAVSAKLGIPYYVLDFSKEFKSGVIDYFCREYADGATPNPCILCNQKIKFSVFLKKALELGCEYIATGHYAGIGRGRLSGRYYIKEGADKAKDQSYFLGFIPQDALARSVFPLGAITKEKARSMAKKMGLKVHNKSSSQEICFIEKHYADYLRKKGASGRGEGDILNVKGEKIGRHKGIHSYTIGQRKGLGIAHTEPLYVVSIDKNENTVTAGVKSDVMKRVFTAENPSWMAISALRKPSWFLAKIRYGHRKAAALVKNTDSGGLKITFEEPQAAITSGQAVVLYRKDAVFGAAWIDKVLE